MTCRRARKLIPLCAGNDLRPRLGRAVFAHIDACPACAKELGEFRQSLARIKAAAGAEGGPDWSEGRWQALMARATQGGRSWREDAGVFGARRLWPRWAAASALGALVGFAVLSLLFKGPGPGPAERPEPPLALADAGRAQNVVSMTMVSQETGLQVVWFLDKNFDYQGE